MKLLGLVHALATVRTVHFGYRGDGTPQALVELDERCGVRIMAWFEKDIAAIAQELRRGDFIWISGHLGVRRTVFGREYLVVNVIEYAHVVVALKNRVSYMGSLPQKMFNG